MAKQYNPVFENCIYYTFLSLVFNYAGHTETWGTINYIEKPYGEVDCCFKSTATVLLNF